MKEQHNYLLPIALSIFALYTVWCCFMSGYENIGTAYNTCLSYWFGAARYGLAVIIAIALYQCWRRKYLWVYLSFVYILDAAVLSTFYPDNFGTLLPMIHGYITDTLKFGVSLTIFLALFMTGVLIYIIGRVYFTDLLKVTDTKKECDSPDRLIPSPWRLITHGRRGCAQMQNVLSLYGVDAAVVGEKDSYSAVKYYVRLNNATKHSEITAIRKEIALAFQTNDDEIIFSSEKNLITISINKKDKKSPGINMFFAVIKSLRDPLAILLGIDTDGQPIVVNLFSKTHLLMAGGSGSGKTTMIYSLIASLAKMNSPEELGMIILDGKHSDLAVLNALPHLAFDVALEAEAYQAAIDYLSKEVKARQKQKAEKLRIGQQARFKPLLFLIDEIDEIIKTNSHLLEQIDTLSGQARSSNVLIIITAKHPDSKTIPTSITANFLAHLCLKVGNKSESQIILGSGNIGGAGLSGLGDFIYDGYGYSMTRGQGFNLPEENMLTIIKKIAAMYGGRHMEMPDVNDSDIIEGERRETKGDAVPEYANNVIDLFIPNRSKSAPSCRNERIVVHYNESPVYAAPNDSRTFRTFEECERLRTENDQNEVDDIYPETGAERSERSCDENKNRTEKIIELKRMGMSYGRIAQAVGLGKTTVYNLCKERLAEKASSAQSE